MLLALAPQPATAAEPGGRTGPCWPRDQNAVTIVVQYGDLGPATEQYCAHDLAPGTTGAEALRLVGVAVTGTSGVGAGFICRVNGWPAPDQVIGLPDQTGYVETCVQTPPAQAYWTYWQAPAGGDWSYASQGYLTSQVQLGGFEAYSFLHAPASADSAQPTIPPIRPAARQPGDEEADQSAVADQSGEAGSSADASVVAASPTAGGNASDNASTSNTALSKGTVIALAVLALVIVARLIRTRRRNRSK
jgi:hypothetical protein